ncbi:MerR family transcriptional regulator [Nocardiopsis sp. CT-R113]|uniref:MerR family transcriptional regulator n=1 Tax=Nocardiopsis codii TaxID=3065942 RepID=A0ABU7K4C8_9ACTN|nr:MerR family transcriptional regulator [Nocardiopsis sp. CT-R113]MEE2037098.1 MerR family transcriptional regulator [Nocardiopsis sp. CT-R113]
MRIGELAEQTGASVRSLRYYEKQGMLYSERSSSGQRHYGEDAVSRVVLIRQFFAVGMNSTTIAALLPHIKTNGERCPPQVLRRLIAELERIDTQAEELARARQTLDGMVKATQEAMRGE